MNRKHLKDLIIMNVTGLTKSQLFLNKEISEKDNKEIKEKISRLDSGEPIEYIINKAEFYSLDFYVDSRVLIPRNDTEIMVEQAIKTINGKDNIALIDIGTGSSCIPIAILKKTDFIEQCFVIDVSSKALEVSKINIKKHNLEDKITQIEGDLLNNLNLSKGKEIEQIIITANLPYVKQDDFENMSDETIKYEPDLALYGGEETGFELYERLIAQCLELRKKGHNITLFIEIGFDQYNYSKKYLENLGLSFEYFKDNGGVWRCIKIEF